jgi:hypothetical protein
MTSPFVEDMDVLIRAFHENEYAEVEFRAHRVYLSAKRLGRLEVANAAATVVAAYRLSAARGSQLQAVDWLARLTNAAMRD